MDDDRLTFNRSGLDGLITSKANLFFSCDNNNNSDDDIVFGTGAPPNTSVGGVFEEIMRIQGGSKEVGINVTDPQTTLDVDGTFRLRNLGSGTVMSDVNGNISVSSDKRLKKDIHPFNRGLNAIKELKPVTYRWNDLSNNETNGLYTGFIAQNVKEYIPEAVGTDKDDFLTLSDRPIIAVLVNSINEQQKLIDSIREENKSLQKEIQKVKKLIMRN